MNDTSTDTSIVQQRIGELCHQFKLPTMGALSVSRFTDAGHGDALATFLEVLEEEAEDRRHRRINRLRKEAKLPSGKTWEPFDYHRLPLALRQQMDLLAQGSFVRLGINVLAFGLPGTGKTHALCALGHRLVQELGPPSGTWTCPGDCASWTTSISCCWTIWATSPRAPSSPRFSLPSSPSATNAGPWVSPPTWSSQNGSASSPTPWPLPRPSTGWCIIPSSRNLTYPATVPTSPSSGAKNRR